MVAFPLEATLALEVGHTLVVKDASRTLAVGVAYHPFDWVAVHTLVIEEASPFHHPYLAFLPLEVASRTLIRIITLVKYHLAVDHTYLAVPLVELVLLPFIAHPSNFMQIMG